MINFYEILGLESTATALEIKTAFRQLAKLYHPDKNPIGKEQFTKVLVAYETLSDPDAKLRYDYKLSYAQSESQKANSNPYNHYKNYEEQELKRRRYYEEHIKKYEKRTHKKVVEPELTENYNEFKYILYATPIAVILFLLILNLASNDRSFSPSNQTLLSNSSLNSVSVASQSVMFDERLNSYFEVFGQEAFDRTSEVTIKVQNLMLHDIALCVFNSNQEFLRKIFLESGSSQVISELPAGKYMFTVCQFSGSRATKENTNTLEHAIYYKNKTWLVSESTNLLTLSPEIKNEFVEITKEEFFMYPKKDL